MLDKKSYSEFVAEGSTVLDGVRVFDRVDDISWNNWNHEPYSVNWPVTIGTVRYLYAPKARKAIFWNAGKSLHDAMITPFYSTDPTSIKESNILMGWVARGEKNPHALKIEMLYNIIFTGKMWASGKPEFKGQNISGFSEAEAQKLLRDFFIRTPKNLKFYEIRHTFLSDEFITDVLDGDKDMA